MIAGNLPYITISDNFPTSLLNLSPEIKTQLLRPLPHLPLLQPILNINQVINPTILPDIQQKEQKTNLVSLSPKYCPYRTLNQQFYLMDVDVTVHPGTEGFGVPFVALGVRAGVCGVELVSHSVQLPHVELHVNQT